MFHYCPISFRLLIVGARARFRVMILIANHFGYAPRLVFLPGIDCNGLMISTPPIWKSDIVVYKMESFPPRVALHQSNQDDFFSHEHSSKPPRRSRHLHTTPQNHLSRCNSKKSSSLSSLSAWVLLLPRSPRMSKFKPGRQTALIPVARAPAWSANEEAIFSRYLSSSK